MNQIENQIFHISLSTAHPAKFAAAVELALENEKDFNFERKILSLDFVSLLQKQEHIITVGNLWKQVRDIIKKQVEEKLKAGSYV